MDFRNLEMVGRWSSYLWVGAELPVTVVGRGRWWVGGELGRAAWRMGGGRDNGWWWGVFSSR